MTPYVYGRNDAGVHVINPKFTLEKIKLAARIICAIENPADVVVVCGRFVDFFDVVFFLI
jgi:small subunit ribosomal protein SAe